MKNPITITLSYTARMLIAATGSTPPAAYRIDLYDAAPEHVTAHAEKHDITTVTVTADDIQAHGSVCAAAVAILTDAAPEPAATEPQPTAEDVTRAANWLAFTAYQASYYGERRAPTSYPAAKAALLKLCAKRGHSERNAQTLVASAQRAGRHEAAERRHEDAEDARLFARLTPQQVSDVTDARGHFDYTQLS